MTQPTAGRIAVRYRSRNAVQEAYSRDSASLPIRLSDRAIAVFFPEDDETLVARVTAAQADYLATIPDFVVEGRPVVSRPTTGVSSWHEQGEMLVAKNRGMLAQQAQSDPNNLLRSLFGDNNDIMALVAQAIAAKVSGSVESVVAPAAAPLAVHNIDIYEMMDLVDGDEAVMLLEEFDPTFDVVVAPRSAIYTRLVRLVDENALLFHRLNRRRGGAAEVAAENAEA